MLPRDFARRGLGASEGSDGHERDWGGGARRRGYGELSEREFGDMWRALPAAEFPHLNEGPTASRGSFEGIVDFSIRVLIRGLLGGSLSAVS